MSWGFHMDADLGGTEPVWLFDTIECTYNLAPMFFEAFADARGIRIISDKAGSDCIPLIESAIAKMKAEPEKYRAMNPKNGWGDYDGALRTLEGLIEWCRKAPRAV